MSARAHMRASSVAVDSSATQGSFYNSKVMNSSKRWSSVNEYNFDRSSMSREFSSNQRGRGRTPNLPTYTDALIKCSQRLRERSMSPAPPPLLQQKVSPYKCNMDYYRGKVKSVYEKEPGFRDFVRNIPLSESNVYDMNNLTRLKRRFNNQVMGRWGRDATPDPLKPSRNSCEIYEPVADKLASKHKSVPPLPNPLPYIYVYHRSTRY